VCEAQACACMCEARVCDPCARRVRGACVRHVCATRVRDACVRRVFERGGEMEVVGTTHWLAMLMAMKLAGVDGLGARRTRRTPSSTRRALRW
jgi:hypothetical protein